MEAGGLQKRESPGFPIVFGRTWTLTELSVVEAAGIEPASENVRLKASTGLGQIVISISGQPLPRHPKIQSE